MTFRRCGAQRARTGRHEQRGRRRDRVRPRGRARLGAREAGEPGRPGRDLEESRGAGGSPKGSPWVTEGTPDDSS